MPRPRIRLQIAFIASLLLIGAGAGCSRSCSKTSTADGPDAAVVDPVDALLADDATDKQIAEVLQGKDLTTWVVELRYGGGQGGPPVRLALNGNGRVSRWDDPTAQGAPDDTLVLPKEKALRVFIKFEKAQFAGFPATRPGGGGEALPTTMALTRDNQTVAITRVGTAEPIFRALVKLFRETCDIANQPHTDEDCRWVSQCKKAGRCKGQGTHCVAGSDSDCKATELCKTDGLCAARNGVCVAATEADCKASTACAAQGKCAVFEGACAVTMAGCKASSACKTRGSCTMKADACVAARDADCRTSSSCTEAGLCTAREGACVAARDADCRAAKACKDGGLCVAKCGRCVKSSDEKCTEGVAAPGASVPAASASASAGH